MWFTISTATNRHHLSLLRTPSISLRSPPPSFPIPPPLPLPTTEDNMISKRGCTTPLSHGVGDVRQVVGGGGQKEKQVGAGSGGVVGGGGGEKVGDKVENKVGDKPKAEEKPRIIPGEAQPKAKKGVPVPLVEVETKHAPHTQCDIGEILRA